MPLGPKLSPLMFLWLPTISVVAAIIAWLLGYFPKATPTEFWLTVALHIASVRLMRQFAISVRELRDVRQSMFNRRADWRYHAWKNFIVYGSVAIACAAVTGMLINFCLAAPRSDTPGSALRTLTLWYIFIALAAFVTCGYLAPYFDEKATAHKKKA